MKSLTATLMVAALAMAGCGTDTPAPPPPPPPAVDAGADAPPPPPPPGDAGATNMYPAGPYGSRVCARLEPFRLNACDGTSWNFAGDDFFDSNLTVVIISAGWCVPCQREAQVLMRELVEPYAGRGVRIVTVLVQDPNRQAITTSFCNTWRTRYNLDIPVLMDPRQELGPFYPGLAFPGNLIIDRQGRIRWREYGAEMSLGAIKRAIDAVLAEPAVCRP